MGWAWLLGLVIGRAEAAEPAETVESAETVAPAGTVAPAESVEPTRPIGAVQPPRFIEPQRSPSRERAPRGRRITRFTDRPPLVRPALRVAPGFSARLTDRPYAAFGFDALASVMFGLHGGYRQWALAPEVGYSLRTPRLEHRVLGGLGLVYGVNAESWSVGLLPRVVLQPDTGMMAIGVRNGLWFDFAENGFSVELSHQWLQRSGAVQHELQLTLGLDLAMLAFVLANARLAWL